VPKDQAPTTDKKTIGLAPKTCGEVTDRAVFAALGCEPDPAYRPAPVIQTTQPVTAHARCDGGFVCLDDAACRRELEDQEIPDRRDAIPGSPTPGGVFTGSSGTPVPGGVFPGFEPRF